MKKNRSNEKCKRYSIGKIKRTLYSSMTKEKNDKNAITAFKTPPYQKRNTTSGKEKKNVDVRVNSISEVDTSELKLPLIAVYAHPEDYPGNYVARVYDVDVPTNTVIVKESLEEIEADIQENTGKVFLKRRKEDVPALVGVWV